MSRAKNWREKLFLGLVQIEINLCALLSFCTKPRKSFSCQIFSREGGGDKPSGIDNIKVTTMIFGTGFNKLAGFGAETVRKRARQADTEQPIAPPAWPSYGTHLPLRNLCVLRTVCAVVSRFCGRHRAHCAGRGILGRHFGLKDDARPRTWRYAIAHSIRDKVHITNSWQSSRTCPMCIIVTKCIW